jgi:serine protease Do
MKAKLHVTLVFALALGLSVALSGVLRGPASPPASGQEVAVDEQEVAELEAFAGKLEALFKYAAEQAGPAVVSIRSEVVVRGRVPTRRYRDPFFDDFFGGRFRGFEDFFGYPGQEYEDRRQGLGSGMILDAEGHVLTNYHVIRDADQLTVQLADGREFEAKPVGTDEDTELAVIKLQGRLRNLPTVRLGDSDELSVGQWVLAIGNPFGFMHTVSAGIVSAKGRTGLGIAKYESLIQTDAAINPGNSGGPLINLHGEVVGINTAIVSRSGGYMGIGFAIPANTASSILEDLIAGRRVERGWLGVSIKELTPDLAESFGFEGRGVLVEEVFEDSPAGDAGVQAGDIIMEYDGRPVESVGELQQRVAATEPESEVRMRVWRDGREVSLDVRTGDLAAAPGEFDWLGLRVGPLTEEYARRLGRRGLRGIAVTDVEPGSAAARVLSAGDVILSVNRVRVDAVDAYRKRVEAARESGRVLLHFVSVQTGRQHYVVLSSRGR